MTDKDMEQLNLLSKHRMVELIRQVGLTEYLPHDMGYLRDFIKTYVDDGLINVDELYEKEVDNG